MKKNILYYFIIPFLWTISFSFSLNAQTYNDAETEYLMTFFDYNSGQNWDITGLTDDPSSLSPDEKMDFLVNEGIISVEDGFVTEIKLDKPYTGPLELVDFEQLEELEIKETSLTSFKIENSPLENIHLESNNLLKTIHIESCERLNKILVTPDPHLAKNKYMSLETVKVYKCQNLEILDLSGKSQRPVEKINRFHNNLSTLVIEECPSLKRLNTAGSNLSTFQIDTPENILTLNAFNVYMNDLSSFVNLEEFTGYISEYIDLPFSLKTLISPFESIGSGELDLSGYTSLEELLIYENSLTSFIPPPHLDLEKLDMRYNKFSNEEIRKIIGDISLETIENYKIYPQKLNVYHQLSSLNYPVIGWLGDIIDLNDEKYEGVESSFKWYKIPKEEQTRFSDYDLYAHKSYYPLIEEWQNAGKLEELAEGPLFTPGEDLYLENILCIMEPVGYTQWDQTDPRMYYRYEIVPYPEMHLKLKVDGELTDIQSGGLTKVKEDSEVIFYMGFDEEYTNPFRFFMIKIFGRVNEDEFSLSAGFSSDNELYLSDYIQGKGKYEVKIDRIQYYRIEYIYGERLHNENYTIQVGEDTPVPPPDDTPPRLQYKVKIEEGPYTNVRTGSTTTEYEGTNVYLGIIPDAATGDIDYDEWKITYTGPDEKQMTIEKQSAEILYAFNPEDPHNKTGDYTYLATRLHLYKGGQEVDKSPFSVNDPYTIRIMEKNPLPDGLYLQYRVKINDGSYVDVPTGGTTIEREGTEVRLGIVPVDESGSIVYDEWKISYNNPVAGGQSSGNVARDVLYEFNPANPHHTTGEYPYLTYRLHLYENGTEIPNSPYTINDPYTIIITDIPDTPIISMKELSTACPGEKELQIPYFLFSTGKDLEYKILFIEDASSYAPLPENYFTVNIPAGTPAGTYRGELLLRYSTDHGIIYHIPFYISIPEALVITRQPQSVSHLCPADSFSLSVEVKGNALRYQWYHNFELIRNATAPVYQNKFTEMKAGDYFVDIIDSCGIIRSDTVQVSGSNLWIERKWDDVLFIYNKEGIYTSFQWYKDGKEIKEYGTSIYYTEEGLSGSYSVRAYRADGSYDESCPYVIMPATRSGSLMVRPNPVRRHTQLTMNFPYQGDYVIRVINLSGQLIYTDKRKGNENSVDISFPAGIYLFTVQFEDGKQYVEKIVVTD